MANLLLWRGLLWHAAVLPPVPETFVPRIVDGQTVGGRRRIKARR